MTNSEHNFDIKLSDFSGFSKAKVELYQNRHSKTIFVRKTGDIQRNYDKIILLSARGFLVPHIINKAENCLDMQYIDGNDIRTYLLHNDINKLIDFICNTVNKFNLYSTPKDYTDIYQKNLEFLATDQYLPFTSKQLTDRLPKILPSGICHGDFTLENLIYSKEDKFVLIDVSTGDYDSWVFDLAKMRQDLDGKWFLRNTQTDLSAHLAIIRTELKRRYPQAFNDHLYILMLLRVYKHCFSGSKEHKLILTEINRLWK